MNDLFGPVDVIERPFKDIRNQRETVAEEKARLALELNTLCKVPPKSLGSASINRVRQFMADHASCMKTLKSKTASRNELQAAINVLKGYE